MYTAYYYCPGHWGLAPGTPMPRGQDLWEWAGSANNLLSAIRQANVMKPAHGACRVLDPRGLTVYTC